MLLRQKTGNSVGVEFRLGNIGVDRIVEMLKNNDIVNFCAHD